MGDERARLNIGSALQQRNVTKNKQNQTHIANIWQTKHSKHKQKFKQNGHA